MTLRTLVLVRKRSNRRCRFAGGSGKSRRKSSLAKKRSRDREQIWLHQSRPCSSTEIQRDARRSAEALASRQALHCQLLGEAVVEAEKDGAATQRAAWEKAHAAAERSLRSIGAVNPLALEEYAALTRWPTRPEDSETETDAEDADADDEDDGGSPFLTEGSEGSSTLLADAYAYAAPALRDLDGDGHTDVVVLWEDELVVYRSDGGALPSSPTYLPKPAPAPPVYGRPPTKPATSFGHRWRACALSASIVGRSCSGCVSRPSSGR